MSKALAKIEKLKGILGHESVRAQFENALRDNAGPFRASIIDLYSSDTSLQQCEPKALVLECLKAATLKLPINKQLGFAYIVPYKTKGVLTPNFQIGYKGYIQLAMRSGQYRTLNANCVYEGQKVHIDYLTGSIEIEGEPKNDKVIGYFAYMELVNGFKKTLYMTKEQAMAWGKRYSKSYQSTINPWKTYPDEMALKTVIRRLLSKWGIMSIDMQQALVSDVDTKIEEEINANANSEIIDISIEGDEEEQEGKEKQKSKKEQKNKSEQKEKAPEPGY